MAVLGLLVGGVAVIGIQVYAQQGSATTTQTPTVQTQTPTQTAQVQNQDQATNDSESETSGPADTNQGHKPLGGDGVVSSISGTTIVMAEESNEGGSSYTIDASSAIFTNNGVSAKLSDIKVGDKIFVEGNVSGNSVKATTVSLGHPGDKNGNDANEKSGTETNDNGSETD